MANIFNSVKLTRPSSSLFDLTHDVKMTLKMGDLVPCCLIECVPGDKFKIGNETMLRFAPMIAPPMHRFDVTVHYYFVPNRILWPNWEKWITDADYAGLHPTVFIDEVKYGQFPLIDYLGLPQVTGTNQYNVSALPFAAYQAIFNEYYRDQNLQSEVSFELSDGNQPGSHWYELRKRAWEHDYFTSALPFAQKGDAVSIPLGDVVLKDDIGHTQIVRDPTTFNPITGELSGVVPTGVLQVQSTATALLDPNGSLEIGATSVSDLRRAFRLQEWLERNARAGTRYVENILAHFGVKTSDKRLQRPEYIVGVKSPVQISEVLNTAGLVAEDQLPQGNMSGHGISVAAGNYGSYFCEEHGYIVGIISVMPRTAYQQGVPKHFLKYDDQFKYYWPSFQNIGEQEVAVGEVYADTTNFNGTFGYVPRYAEYKFLQSRVAGAFKNSLNFWHEGRIFANEPALNEEFIQCRPSNRVFAVQDGVDQIYVHCLNKIRAIRRMQKYGNPSF